MKIFSLFFLVQLFFSFEPAFAKGCTDCGLGPDYCPSSCSPILLPPDSVGSDEPWTGRHLACQVGESFSMDIYLGEKLESEDLGGDTFKAEGLTPYGPRREGLEFSTVASISDHSTRVAWGQRLEMDIEAVDAKLYLLDIIGSIYPEFGEARLGTHGAIVYGDGDQENLECEKL